MSKISKVLVVLGLIAAVIIVLGFKGNKQCCDSGIHAPNVDIAASQPDSQPAGQPADKIEVKLPLLLDLGADKCIPCKMMAPILDELGTEYGRKFEVKFIDVWKEQSQGAKYGIRMIPTQIFFDEDGKELWRHEGFMSKGDILSKWQELGIDVTLQPAE